MGALFWSSLGVRSKSFYENLLDADIASNTLSWRWVAGLQTVNKKYIATEENIIKFSSSKFKNFNLPKINKAEIAYVKPLKNEINYADSFFVERKNKNVFLVVENNLDFNFIEYNKEKIYMVILLKLNNEKIKKVNYVKNFKKNVRTIL